MKLINRQTYLSRLTGAIGTPDIKVIAGVRRSGKSTLLEAFRDYIGQNVPNRNIIHINLNSPEFERLLECRPLYDYVNSLYAPAAENFVFIDEAQMCEGFGKAISWLHASEKFDIYVTCSGAFLPNSDMATLFTGRTFEIKVYPFSFGEYMRYFDRSDKYSAFDGYLTEGGMVGSYARRDRKAKADYAEDVLYGLILRDIRRKYKIRDAELMKGIAGFLAGNVSKTLSARNIADALSESGKKVSHTTAGSYVRYLCDAFAFYRVPRYDVKGKRRLAGGDKYYLCDHAFRRAGTGAKNADRRGTLENIVAAELLRRGYEVCAGVLYRKETGFVAMKRNEKIYLRVSDNISDEKEFLREVSALLQIRDAYPKLLIARTGHDEYQYEGIKIVDIADWLTRNG